MHYNERCSTSSEQILVKYQNIKIGEAAIADTLQ